MGYLVALFAGARGETEEAVQTAQRNIQANAERGEAFAKLFVLKTRALLAVLQKDARAFQTLLEQIAQAHSLEAKRGRLRREAGGLLCLDGMALAALARRAPLTFSMDSPYLPLPLLEA